jgi:hypothetical protein
MSPMKAIQQFSDVHPLMFFGVIIVVVVVGLILAIRYDQR